MNRHHWLPEHITPKLGDDCYELCPGPPCDEDHFVIISDSQWCDPEFIFDRLAQLQPTFNPPAIEMDEH